MTLVSNRGPHEHFPYCVLFELADGANEGDGECVTSIDTFRTKWRMSEDRVIQSLKRLQSQRWILLEQDIPAQTADTFRLRINLEKLEARDVA